MHLADHGIAGDAAKLAGDLARRKPVGPELLEQLHPFIRPGHELHVSPQWACDHEAAESLLAVRRQAEPGYWLTHELREQNATRCRGRCQRRYNMATPGRKSRPDSRPHFPVIHPQYT